MTTDPPQNAGARKQSTSTARAFTARYLCAMACLGAVNLSSGHEVVTADSVIKVAGLEREAAFAASQAVIGDVIGEFTLLNREGQPVRLSQYRGKPLLVSFIYTGCMQVCPATTRHLQNALASAQQVFGDRQFNVISIGFNQPDDSPQAMKAFAAQFHIDQSGWDFLSPHADKVKSLTQAFGFSYRATPAGFDHMAQLTLLDANGRVYRQIYGDNFASDAVVEPIKQLLNNSPVSETVSFNGLIDRVRILCTVYDQVTGNYRFQYGLLLEVGGGLTFAIAVLWFFFTEWRTRRRQRKHAPSALAHAVKAQA